MEDQHILLPNTFSERIIRTFGEQGRAWLSRVPEIVSSCIAKWSLKDFRLAQNLSYNLVGFASSPDYGDVVLKIGVPNPELYAEVNALRLFDCLLICKFYDSDMELGAMLLERITPGTDLTHVHDIDLRVHIAADIIANISIKIDNHDGFPTYSSWVQRAFQKARENNIVGTQMFSYIDTAEAWFTEMEASNTPKVLLHGDLHHYNILQDASGGWKAIDPKGVFGLPWMEPARFMENQLDMVGVAEKEFILNHMVTVFSKKYNVTKRTLATCLFIDNVLSTCWNFEEQESPERLMDAVNKCTLIFDYLKTL